MNSPSQPRPRRPVVATVTVAARPRAFGVGLCALAAGAAAACDREKPAPPPPPPPPAVVAPAPVAPDSAPPAAPTTGWDAAAGVALVVPGGDGGALLVSPGVPDSMGVDTARGAVAALPAQVTLFAEHGAVGQARASLAGGGAGEGCGVWPRLRLGPASGANVSPAWTVGLAVAPGATPPVALPLDSLDVLAGPDSAALAAALTRLASALPPPTGVSAATRAALRGVPFRVRRARGFAPDGHTQAVVAALTRTMNQEASPAADAVLLVAERPAGGAGPWRTAYSERAAGREETLPAVNVLAAMRLAGAGGPRAALVVAREDDAGVRYALLERAAPGSWVPRWTSAQVDCGR